MPFLFVDYDQGAGGEYFCTVLSQTEQCNTLETQRFGTRTKIHDKFNGRWLSFPDEKPIVEADPVKFDIVPTHRETDQAQQELGNIKSIRIANPEDPHLWSFLKYNQKTKVMLKVDPSDKHFFGWVKRYSLTTQRTDWVKKIKRDMDGISIALLSQDLDPTRVNKVEMLRTIYNTRMPEPNYEYDLIIPFEKLILDHQWVVDQLQETFGINLDVDKLKKYYTEYADYTLDT